jgi:hypothetical protein
MDNININNDNNNNTIPIPIPIPIDIPKLNTTSDYIIKMYDKLSYTDIYGSSILIVVISTIVVASALSFSLIMQNKKVISDDWVNQRCNPKYIPFAGYIVTPEGKTPGEYTNENFKYCLQNQMVNMTSQMTQPHVYLLNALNAAFNAIAEALNYLRKTMSVLRDNIIIFVEEVMHRIMNIIAPLLKMLLALMDSLHKSEGILAAGLYTFLGTYYTIKAFIGAFFQIVVTLLLIFIGIIGVLWAIPIAWPTALSLTIPVAAFASLFAVMVAVLSITFNLSPVKIPKIRTCFDKNTQFTMYNGTVKTILNIVPGDILADRTRITAKMQLDTSNNRMFALRGVIVSESHQVKYNNKWIFVKDHHEAIEIHGYKEPYIYCLNTSSKEIILNGLQFLDWDELHDESLNRVVHLLKNKHQFPSNIHKHLDMGFDSEFIIELNYYNKQIKDIKIGDVLKTGGKVYGVVEIDGTDLCLGKNNIKLYHLLTTDKIFSSNGKVINDYNHLIDSIV